MEALMLSYQGSGELKQRFLGHVARHQAEDRVLQGTYGLTEGKWKGCATACSLRSLDEIDGRELRVDNKSHADLSDRLGIPLELAHLEDRIFEGLATELARAWPARFADAIPVGRDLTMVWPGLALWLLSDPESGVLWLTKREQTRKAIADVAALYERWIAGDKPSVIEWRKARAAAAASAYASASASASVDTDHADHVAYAAYTAAAASAYASAYTAAAASVDAYAYAYAYADPASEACGGYRKLHWSKIADKLVELMRAA